MSTFMIRNCWQYVAFQRSSRACDGTEEGTFRYATFHRCSKFEWLPVANEGNEKEQKSRTLMLAPSVQKNSIGFVAQRTRTPLSTF